MSKPKFDPTQPFEEISDKPKFDPEQPFEEVSEINQDIVPVGEAALRGAAQGLTFGASDEITGALGSIVDLNQLKENVLSSGIGPGILKTGVQGIADLGSDLYKVATTTNTMEDFIKDRLSRYRNIQQEQQQRNKLAEEQNPMSYLGAELASGIAVPGVGALKAAKTLSKLSKIGLASGAAAGAGYSEGTLEQSPEQIAQDVALGGAIGGAIPLAIKGVQTSVQPIKKLAKSGVDLALDNPTVKNLYESYLMGRTGKSISGVSSKQELNKQIEETSREVLDKVKNLRKEVGSKKAEIYAGVEAKDVAKDIDKLRKDIISNKNVPDSEKLNTLNVLKNYTEGVEQTKLTPITDVTRKQALDQQTEKLLKEQEIAKTSAETNLLKKIQEETVKDDLLNRTATIEKVVPSGKDLLALRQIGEEAKKPQILKGTAKSFTKDIPVEQTPIKFIEETFRAGPEKLGPVELDQFHETVKNLAFSTQDKNLSAQLRGMLPEIRKIQESVLPEEKAQAFKDLRKQYEGVSNFFELTNIDPAQPFISDKEKAIAKFGSIIKRSGDEGISPEELEQKLRKGLENLAVADKKMAQDIAGDVYSLSNQYRLQQEASRDINSSMARGAILGPLASAGMKAANLTGRAVEKTAKFKNPTLNNQTINRIKTQIKNDVTPESLRFQEELTKLEASPNPQVKNARWFKMLQNPIYRNYIQQSEGEDE